MGDGEKSAGGAGSRLHAFAQARRSARSDQKQKAALGVHRRNPVVGDTDRRERIWAKPSVSTGAVDARDLAPDRLVGARTLPLLAQTRSNPPGRRNVLIAWFHGC
jgi:hypothetical protein